MTKPMSENSQWTRVIVLSPPTTSNGALHERLNAQLADRDWYPIVINDPHEAMAELCLRDRAQAARSGWGIDRLEQLAFLILSPQTWPQLDELIHAVRTYVPAATIWTATENEIVQFDGSMPSDIKPETINEAKDQKEPKHGQSDRLTSEEIDMLLNPGSGGLGDGAR